MTHAHRDDKDGKNEKWVVVGVVVLAEVTGANIVENNNNKKADHGLQQPINENLVSLSIWRVLRARAWQFLCAVESSQLVRPRNLVAVVADHEALLSQGNVHELLRGRRNGLA